MVVPCRLRKICFVCTLPGDLYLAISTALPTYRGYARMKWEISFVYTYLVIPPVIPVPGQWGGDVKVECFPFLPCIACPRFTPVATDFLLLLLLLLLPLLPLPPAPPPAPPLLPRFRKRKTAANPTRDTVNGSRFLFRKTGAVWEGTTAGWYPHLRGLSFQQSPRLSVHSGRGTLAPCQPFPGFPRYRRGRPVDRRGGRREEVSGVMAAQAVTQAGIGRIGGQQTPATSTAATKPRFSWVAQQGSTEDSGDCGPHPCCRSSAT